MTKPILVMEKITKQFPGVLALDKVRFENTPLLAVSTGVFF